MWEGGKKDIDKKIQQKATEMGISRETLLKYNIQEFNIRDMGDCKNKCKKCRKNLVCDQHKYKKKRFLMGTAEFDKA